MTRNNNQSSCCCCFFVLFALCTRQEMKVKRHEWTASTTKTEPTLRFSRAEEVSKIIAVFIMDANGRRYPYAYLGKLRPDRRIRLVTDSERFCFPKHKKASPSIRNPKSAPKSEIRNPRGFRIWNPKSAIPKSEIRNPRFRNPKSAMSISGVIRACRSLSEASHARNGLRSINEYLGHFQKRESKLAIEPYPYADISRVPELPGNRRLCCDVVIVVVVVDVVADFCRWLWKQLLQQATQQ